MLASSAEAASTKRLGAWELSIDKDRFSGDTKAIAASIQDGNGIAIRCFPSGLSVAIGEIHLGPGRYEEGMEFEIQFRADEREIVSTTARALNDKFMQIEDSAGIARQIGFAKEAAFRISYRGVTFDKVFKIGKGRPLVEATLAACAK